MAKYDSAGLAMIPSGYKASKVYSLIPNSSDGDFDFARSSSATRVNKDGLIEVVQTNVPRLDYPLIDGVVQDTPSLLLEPSRTNYITYSEAISNAPIKSGANFTDNSAISPDGSQNATKLTALNTDPYFYQSISFSAADYTASIWVKGIGNSIGKEFRIVLGGFTTSPKLVIPSEWTRFEFTATMPSGSASAGLEIPDPPIVGDEVLVWGWQVEQGSYATSYIPTSGDIATRSAETCNGAGTSADFNDSEGVLFAEISALTDEATPQGRVISINDGTSSNRIHLFYFVTDNTIYLNYRSGGATQSTSQYTLSDTSNFNKFAYKWKSGDFATWVNGFEVDTDNNTTMIPSGTLSQLDFNQGGGGGNFEGKSKQLITFKQALTDAELEDLTSWDSFSEMAEAQQYQTV